MNHFKIYIKPILHNFHQHTLFHKDDPLPRLEKKLIICNHELLGPDMIYMLLFLLSIAPKGHQINVVFKKELYDKAFLEQLFYPVKLISTGGSTPKIIQALNQDETVVLFVSLKTKKAFLESKNINKIISETGCTAQYFTIDLDESYNYLASRHWLTSNLFQSIAQNTGEFVNENEKQLFYQIMSNNFGTILKINLKKRMNFYIKWGQVYSDTTALFNNISFLTQTNLYGNKQNYNNFTQLKINNSLIRNFAHNYYALFKKHTF